MQKKDLDAAPLAVYSSSTVAVDGARAGRAARESGAVEAEREDNSQSRGDDT
jgi:hypothetical protein